MELSLKETFERAKNASRELALIDDARKNDILNAVADAIESSSSILLEANACDLARMDNMLSENAAVQSNPSYPVRRTKRSISSWVS